MFVALLLYTQMSQPLPDINPNIVTKSTVEFALDTVANSYDPSTESQYTDFSLVDVDGSRDIISFLERPIKMTGGVLQTTDTGTLWSVDPMVYLASQWAPKLSGIQLFRADIEITITVNALKFQTGRYIVGFLPSLGVPIGSANFNQWEHMHRATLCQITQLPHVEIDVACQTSATLVLPWKQVLVAWPNQTNRNPQVGFGRLFLYPYSPMGASGSSSTAGYTVWARMTNVSLSVPTVTQSGSAGEIEQKKAGLGPISSILSRVSKASSILGAIPMISPYANTVAWTSKILSGAASAMGWSKPLDLRPSMPMVRRQLAFSATTDQPSSAQPLGLVSDNRVVANVLPGIDSVDELSIDYIKQKPAYFTKFVWSQTSNAEDVLATIPVNPVKYYGYSDGYTIVPCGYPTKFFSLWRGGLKFKIKIVKNTFYTGRLSFSFVPFETGGSSPALTEATAKFTHRAIVDVVESSEFEFEVPFVSSKLYLTNSQNTGSLFISVVDPLRAPDNCPTAVDVLLEISGSSDLEYADYDLDLVSLYAPYSIQSGDVCSNPPMQLGRAAVSTSSSLHPASVAIGESIRSLRQIAKVFNVFRPYSPLLRDGTKSISFAPFVLPFVAATSAAPGAISRPLYKADVLTLVGGLYSGSTGGSRVNLLPLDASATSPQVLGTGIAHNSNISATQALVPTADTLPWVRQLHFLHQEPVVDVNVPAYMTTVGRNNAASLINETFGVTNSEGSSRVQVVSSTLATPAWSGAYLIARQASDDWNAYGFVSTPLLIVDQ